MLLDVVFRHLTSAQPIPKVFCRHATVVHSSEIREREIYEIALDVWMWYIRGRRNEVGRRSEILSLVRTSAVRSEILSLVRTSAVR